MWCLAKRPLAAVYERGPHAVRLCANAIEGMIGIGAKSYGMRTAFIARRKRPFGQTPHQPDLIVANFAELAAALT